MLSIGIFNPPNCFEDFEIIIFGKSGGDDVMELCVVLDVWWYVVAAGACGR